MLIEPSHSEPKVQFLLSPERWEEFSKALDAKPRDLPQLRKLLTEPSIFDEAP